MPQRVRIADRFKTQSAEQLVTMAGAVITGLTNNPAFPAPTAFEPRRPLRPQRISFSSRSLRSSWFVFKARGVLKSARERCAVSSIVVRPPYAT